MKIKIAIFGREEVIEQLYFYTKEQTNIEIIPFMYTEAKKTTELVEKAIMCDVYLFTEALSFLYAKDMIKKRKLPAVQITCNDYMVLTTLFRVKNDEHHNIKRLSLDVGNTHDINEVLTELKTENHEVYTYVYGDEMVPSIDHIANAHQKLWKEGKVDHILTSIKEVEKKLKDRDIPVTCMRIPRISMERAIQKAKSIVTLQYNNTQIVAGYVHIKNVTCLKATDEELLANNAIPHLYQILHTFAHRTDSTLITSKENQFAIFGTQKLLKYITNHYRDFPLLEKIKQTIHEPVAIGFGLGLTTKEAESNAGLALARCSQNENSNCYIVNDRRDIIGPLGIKKQFDSARLYHSLIHKARLNNELSYNFIDFIQKRNNEPFSSNDIALYYRITKRSAERTINKLLFGKVIKVVGEEKPYVKGRPRKLFQIVI